MRFVMVSECTLIFLEQIKTFSKVLIESVLVPYVSSEDEDQSLGQ